MRKSMLLAALLAMVLVATVPALAQVGQGIGVEESESGDAEPEVAVANKGANVNSCNAILQQTNTGNQQNAQGVVQYSGTVDDVEISGTAIIQSPEAAVDCQQLIEQAAAAGKGGEAKAGKAEAKAEAPKAEAPKAEAKAAPAEAPKAEAPKAEAPKVEEKKELPPTGGGAGSASLLALGAGALLVAGGLLARRIIR